MGTYQPLKAAERRVADRRCALDDYLCLVDLGDSRSAMLLDVSETGIGVQSVEGPGEGFTTTFRFQLPDTAVLVEGEGEIAWADRAGRMGVRFTRLAPELKPELRTWVSSEANPLFAHQPVTEEMADLDARDRVAQLEARIIVSGWAQLQALNFLVDQISAMTQASGVAIAVEDGSGIVCKASAGTAPEVGVRVNPRSGLSWECVRTKEVVNCVDTENDPRVDRLVCRQLNMRSAMLVPVMKDGRVGGLVEVFSSRPHAFSNQTVILLRRVGEAVASLDETATGVEQEPLIPAESRPTTQPVVTKTEPIAAKPAATTPIEQPKPPVPTTAPAAIPRPQAVAPSIAQPIVPAAPPVAAAPAPIAARPPAPVTPTVPVAPPIVTAPTIVTAPAIAKAPAASAPAPARIETPARVDAPPLTEKKPVPAVASAPAPVFTPSPRPVAPVTPDVATKIGMPFAQEIAAATKPVEIPPRKPEVAPVKPVEVAAPVVVKPVEKIPPPKPVEAAKAQPLPVREVVKETERAKPIVERIEIPMPPAVPKEKPVDTAAPAVVKPIVMDKPREVPPVVASTAYQDAPLPAVAFGGAPAAARRAAEAAARSAKKDIAVDDSSHIASESSLRKVYIGVAVAVFFAISAVGGWYIARGTPKTTQAAAPQPVTPASTTNAAPATIVPAAVTTPANTAAAPILKPPGNSTGAAPVSAPITSAKPAAAASQPAKNPAPDQPSAGRTDSPTFIARSESPAVEATPAPPVAIAPPNTVGMASLLAGPVAAPKLGKQVVSQGVTGGKQIVHLQPIYPSSARAMHLSGVVTINLHVAKNGAVSRAEVVSGHPLLNAAALDAVKRWRYQPFMLNGEPIENDVSVQVRFDMPR